MSQTCVRRWGFWPVCADEPNLCAQMSPLPSWEIGCLLSFLNLQLFCWTGCFSQNGILGIEPNVVSTDGDYDARRIYTLNDISSHRIFGAADWKKFKHGLFFILFFFYPLVVVFMFRYFSHIFHVFFNFVLLFHFSCFFLVIFVFSMMICHYSCVLRLVLSGSFTFSQFPGYLCDFDTCSPTAFLYWPSHIP